MSLSIDYLKFIKVITTLDHFDYLCFGTQQVIGKLQIGKHEALNGILPWFECGAVCF